MKRLLEYIAESEFANKRPVPGDRFSISTSTDTIVETVVCEIEESGNFCVQITEAGFTALVNAGVIAEDFTQLLPHNQQKQNQTPTDGHMSPINGNAFKPYDRNENPRTWFKSDVKRSNAAAQVKDKEVDDGFEDGIKGLHEAKVSVLTPYGTIETNLSGVAKTGSHQWFCKVW